MRQCCIWSYEIMNFSSESTTDILFNYSKCLQQHYFSSSKCFKTCCWRWPFLKLQWGVTWHKMSQSLPLELGVWRRLGRPLRPWEVKQLNRQFSSSPSNRQGNSKLPRGRTCWRKWSQPAERDRFNLERTLMTLAALFLIPLGLCLPLHYPDSRPIN